MTKDVKLKGQCLGARNALVLHHSEYHKWQICAPCDLKTIFLSLSIEVYAAEIAVSGVF